ncbi:MAG: hypothetical protein M1826_004997 [Phylliscum demangeonii]|nr:MAG: hypothetical protein M1826_004997 [Phylliscum demangeonii]
MSREVSMRMDLAVQVGEEQRIAIELHRDPVHAFQQDDLDALVGQAWLGDASHDAAIPTIMVQSWLSDGAVGECFEGTIGPTTVVLKVADPGQEQVLEQEAFLYEQDLSTLTASRGPSIVPKFYGFLSSGRHRVPVCSHAGKCLKSSDQLTLDAK